MKNKNSYAVILVVCAICSCAHSGQYELEFIREFNDDLFALTSAFVPFLAIGLSENETKLLKRRMELEF